MDDFWPPQRCPDQGYQRRTHEAEHGGDPASSPLQTSFTSGRLSARRRHGVPAKGLTGQAYEGHYFWDTETYLLPFLIYTSPRIAQKMLTFRYKMLRRHERAPGNWAIAPPCSGGAP